VKHTTVTKISNLRAAKVANRTYLTQFWSVTRSPLVLETVMASDNNCTARIRNHLIDEHLPCEPHHILCAYNASSLNSRVHVVGVLCEH